MNRKLWLLLCAVVSALDLNSIKLEKAKEEYEKHMRIEIANHKETRSLSTPYSGFYQAPDFRMKYHRERWLSKNFTHFVKFIISQGGYTGKGKQSAPGSTEKNLGEIVIGLYGYIVPNTVRNFCQLANGLLMQDMKPRSVHPGMVASYAGSQFHRIIKNFMIQGGDIMRGDGRGSISIFGYGGFPDERFSPHDEIGLISMANSGPNTNGSQFFITTVLTPWLDNKHVVIGKVVRGMDLVMEMEGTDTDSRDHPTENLWIKYSSCMYSMDGLEPTEWW